MSINSPANQYAMDPRQLLCWGYYVNPKSETFGNALRSALKAGYEDVYARSITSTQWFADKVRRLGMLSKAEKVLEETLDMDTSITTIVNEVEVVKIDPALAKIKQDTAKFIAERVGKEYYSTRSEVTGADGKEIKGNTIIFKEFNLNLNEADSQH